MIPDAIEVHLTPKERAELEGRLRAGSTEQRQLLRIRIVLEAAEGHATREIARWLEDDGDNGQPLARPFCARAAGWARRPAALGRSGGLWRGHGQAHSCG